MENILVASTNLYGIAAIINCYKHRNLFDGIMIAMPMIASTFYHLAEHSKHFMPGFAMHKFERKMLNYDRFFAVISMAYFGIKYIERIKNSNILIPLIIAMVSGYISEHIKHDHSIESIHKSIYMITHAIWHISLFHIVYILTK